MARTLALIGMALIAPAISAGASEDADQPATHRVSRGPFRVVVSLPAVLESPEAREVSVRPDEWTSLVVREAVDHGVEVREGQVVLALETEEIDEAIRSAELDLELSRIEHEGAQRDLELLEKSSALDVDVAERAKRRADESLVRFIEINEPLSEKRARLSAENSKDYLAYQLEELEQLEKMYRADDLTEETEEIILRRQRDSVKRAKFALEESEIARDEMLQVGLQVRRESLENSVRRQSIALQKARETAERALATQRVTVEKKRLEHERNARKLERLRADRELLDVRAPIDGIVYHGRATRGKWTALATATEKLRRGSSVARGDIVMTVVPDVALRLRLDLPEAHVHHVRPGLEGSASPAAFPDAELPAAVESVSRVPVAPGIFDAVVELEGSEHLERLVAGMACTVELVPYSSGDALTVPNGAIHEESDVTVVWLQGRDGGAPVKRRVRTGKTDGTRTEILDGLEEGDEVLLEKPAS